MNPIYFTVLIVVGLLEFPIICYLLKHPLFYQNSGRSLPQNFLLGEPSKAFWHMIVKKLEIW